ncbi:MAG: Hsp33 family molecular chaperone HslO [Pseudomonadota bacterium]
MSDFLKRFQFLDGPVRGEVCQLDLAYQAVLARHDYPACIKTLLGQALAGVALMAANLKFEGSLILQIQGDGPMSVLMVECNHRGEIRGIARYDEARIGAQTGASWTDLTGQGQLILTLDPDDGERYQGIVALAGDSLGEALAGYFEQSEQLPTYFNLAADAERAGGLMLQVLPQVDAADDMDLWARAQSLAITLKPEELLGLTAEDMLYRLFHEEEVELYPSDELHFHCSCSRERSGNALRAIELDELLEIAGEQNGQIEVDCQFCRQRYVFDLIDLRQLHMPSGVGSENLQ